MHTSGPKKPSRRNTKINGWPALFSRPTVLLGVVNRVEVAALRLFGFWLGERYNVRFLLGPCEIADEYSTSDNNHPKNYFRIHVGRLYPVAG